MSISEMMADPKIRDAYLALDTNRAPVQLADDYLTAKLSGRAADCKALEHHIRELARSHFHVGDVLEALSAMERHKARRKMGKGAPRMYQDIAGQLELMYAAGEYTVLDDGRIKFMVYLQAAANGWTDFEGPCLKVTCKNMPGAVALVCAKYRKGLPKRNHMARSTVCPPCNWRHKS